MKLDGSNSARQRGPHPGLRIRGVDTSGFAAGFQDDRGDLVAAKPQPSAGYGSRTAEVEQKLDSNLGTTAFARLSIDDSRQQLHGFTVVRRNTDEKSASSILML